MSRSGAKVHRGDTGPRPVQRGATHNPQQQHCCRPAGAQECTQALPLPAFHLPRSGSIPPRLPGDYAGASNQDDELAIISARLPFVPQKAGTTPAAATPLAPGPAGADGLLLASVGGVVSRPDKTHYFAFTAPAAGPITISALPVADWCGPYGSAGAGNLNIQLQLLLNGAVVCSSNPDAPAGGTTVLANASISATATAGGAYVIALTAVGSAAGGYSDYGSLGGYTLQASWPSASYAAPRRPLRPPRPGRARPAEPFVMPAAGGVNGTLQPRVIIVPGITLCNVEGAAWYSWLRDRLRRAPLFLDVALRWAQRRAGNWGWG